MISIKKVLSTINYSDVPFSIEYRKLDGSYGRKRKVIANSGSGNAVGSRRVMNRSGLLKLKDLESGQYFDIYIDLAVKFNGDKIEFEE